MKTIMQSPKDYESIKDNFRQAKLIERASSHSYLASDEGLIQFDASFTHLLIVYEFFEL